MSKKLSQKPMSVEEVEAGVVALMGEAQAIADQVFGDKSSTYAVHEVYDYLEIADAEDFAEDLKRVYGYAKVAHKTEAPTPEQVFGLFDRIFSSDED